MDKATPKLLMAVQQLTADGRLTKPEATEFKALVMARDERLSRLVELLDDSRTPSAAFGERAKQLLAEARASPATGDRPGTATRKARPNLSVGTDKGALAGASAAGAGAGAGASASSAPAPAAAAAAAAAPADEDDEGDESPDGGAAPGSATVRVGGEESKSARVLPRPGGISIGVVAATNASDEATEEDANLRRRAKRSARVTSLPAALPTHVSAKVKEPTIFEGETPRE